MAPLFLTDNAAETKALPLQDVARLGPGEAQAPINEDFFFSERVLTLAVIVMVAWWLRARDPGFSTAYMDESLYAVTGRMFFAGHFESPLDHPLRWSFGWYLWPMLSALADRIAGIAAVREMAAAAGTVAVVAVYGITRRLYGAAVGLGAAAVFGVSGPAIMASRIATYDAGAICLFTLALWAFVKAWDEKKGWSWLMSAACLFCAFLCKYLIAIYFPFLVLLALWKGWRSSALFWVPLTAASALYGLHYRPELKYLLAYGASYQSLRASASQLWDIYVASRIDLWLIALLALVALVASKRRASLLMWLGAAVGLEFQWKTRADFNFWKHATYVLIFLIPVAVHGIDAAARRFGRSQIARVVTGIASIVVLAGAIAWLGKSTEPDRLIFWPNIEPILSYFEGRLPNNAQLLADDTAFRYYFYPMLRQRQIADPFYFRYGEDEGGRAYSRAADDGWFDYILLDGGMGKEAVSLNAALAGHLSRYTLRMKMPDPTLGHPIEVYERAQPAAAALAIPIPSVQVTTPLHGAEVARTDRIKGQTAGAEPGSKVGLEVFSDRWYWVGNIPLRSDGSFESEPVAFAGRGFHACNHIVRARLYDPAGAPQAVSTVFNVARAGNRCQTY